MNDLAFALECSTGGGLDLYGELLLLPRDTQTHRRSTESDDHYRSRLRLWVELCTCRHGVHVLSHDSSTWSHCQCGVIRMGDDGVMPRQAAQVVAREVGYVKCAACQQESADAEGKAGYVKCAACQ